MIEPIENNIADNESKPTNRDMAGENLLIIPMMIIFFIGLFGLGQSYKERNREIASRERQALIDIAKNNKHIAPHAEYAYNKGK